MDKDTFWQLIARAKADAEDEYDRPEHLRESLSRQTPDEIQAFAEHYRDRLDEAYRWDLWAAAYVINGGCSDDGFAYFLDWLISEGREVFEAALRDPETLADLRHLEEVELEAFRYAADEAYESLAGKAMTLRERPFPGEPAGEAWDEDAVQKVVPKLAAKYW